MEKVLTDHEIWLGNRSCQFQTAHPLTGKPFSQLFGFHSSAFWPFFGDVNVFVSLDPGEQAVVRQGHEVCADHFGW